MSITLTPKDAEFILRFIRVDLEKINEASKESEKSWERLNLACKDEIKGIPAVMSIMEVAREAKKLSDGNVREIKESLQHCIELLTWGSER